MTFLIQCATGVILILFSTLAVSATRLSAGDYHFELEVGGQNRSYYVHVPPLPNTEPLPVVVSLHGGGNAQQHRESSGIDAAADRDGYIAVYPNGSGRMSEHLLTWNAGNCCA